MGTFLSVLCFVAALAIAVVSWMLAVEKKWPLLVALGFLANLIIFGVQSVHVRGSPDYFYAGLMAALLFAIGGAVTWEEVKRKREADARRKAR